MSYEDIINLPHHVSRYHRPMSMIQRAAQFAPFAALGGYKEAILRTNQAVVEAYNRPVEDYYHDCYEGW